LPMFFCAFYVQHFHMLHKLIYLVKEKTKLF
jgi:hypothetical protein